MKVIFKGEEVEVWQISKTGEQPDWVRSAFEAGNLTWVGNRLRLRWAYLKPSASRSFSAGAAGGVGGYVAGFGQLEMADLGDVIDLTNGKIVSARSFAKKYQILEKQ
ncbi:role in replication [Lactococcus termiticola]|uniref:Role in replication n=1 Tax=Lactococcus termiticola TaxID=2169526 RepID=A0A2R5HET0_9LACT|nr:role in replication [Lactococcus termiticola]GBG96559.1 hypothetical protein NtB2_00672 [Lactococcus termiticola]